MKECDGWPPGACEPALAGGMAAGSLVLTLDGALPVEHLTPGDRIVTRRGLRSLRHVAARRVTPALLVRVPAGTLGHDRPERPLWLAADQPVVVTDWRARAIFGAPVVAVPVGRLADGVLLQRERAAEARLFTLHFDRPETVYAEGVQLACPAQPAFA